MTVNLENGLVADILGLAVLFVFLMIVSWFASRILGVRRGFWRSALAAVIGLGVANALAELQFGSDVETIDDLASLGQFGALFLGVLLLSMMLAGIIIDVVLTPRSGPRPPRPRPIRWLRYRIELVRRIGQIALIARRNGLTIRSRASFTTPETALALRKTLEQCGGIFVKFGQIAATRDDLLPPVITSELTKLQASAPPLPPEVVRTVLDGELGELVQTQFQSLSEEPLAAASIGVTHRGTLTDGTPVIVKVQRPGVAELVERDGRVLRWSARQLEARSGGARSLGLLALADELVDGVTAELDFTAEAQHNAQLRANRAGDTGIGIPEVFPDLTTRRVLTMEWVDGKSVADRAAVEAAPVADDVLADRLLHSFLGQVLRDGVYHADPHPGNVLIDEAGTLWLIDYGAVGTLDPITLEALQLMAIAYSTRDPAMLARAVRRMIGPVGEDLDMSSLEFDLGSVLGTVENTGFGPESVHGVLRVLQRHQIPAPRALTILGRSMITLEGTLRTIDPEFQMGPRAQAILKETAGSVDDIRSAAKSELLRAVPSLRSLPPLAEDLGYQARVGRFSMRVDLLADGNRETVDGWLDRALFVIIAIAGLLGSGILLVAAALTPNETLQMYLRVIGLAGLVFSTAMQMRAVAQILRRGGSGRG